MKSNRKTIKIVKSVIIMIALIIGGLFVWNKISVELQKNEAKKAFSEYLKTHYPDLDYVEENLRYLTKGNNVSLDINVIDSEDEDFTLYAFKDGTVTSDYDFRVVKQGNIINRFQEHINQYSIEEKLTELFQDDYKFSSVTFDEGAWFSDPPENDTSVSELLIRYPLICTIYLEDVSKYTQEEIYNFQDRIKMEYQKKGLNLTKVEIK